MEPKNIFKNQNKKKEYISPEIHSEEIFETLALSCGKCDSGPYVLFECYSIPQTS
ncbi:MAG: hypothetical protein ABIB46_04755 [bacterium]